MADQVQHPGGEEPEEIGDPRSQPADELAADLETRIEAQFPALQHNPELRQAIRTVVREQSFRFSGPHPPPQMLAEYERICPGWAVRLLEQGEREQAARLESDRETLAQTRLLINLEIEERAGRRRYQSRGQTFGFIAFVVIAGLGGWALYLGNPAVAITCFTTFVLGVVGMFVADRKSGDSENNKSASDVH